MEIFLKAIGALNDETRVKLLKFIELHGPLCVCDLQESFGMIQSRLSRHLKILKEAGFLQSERKGRWVYFSVKKPDRFHCELLEEIKKLDIELPPLKKGCKI